MADVLEWSMTNGNQNVGYISQEQSYLQSTYSTWSTNNWSFFPDKIPDLIIQSYSLPVWNYGTLSGFITDSQSKTRSTYSDRNWDMERVWAIREGLSVPRLVSRGSEGDLGSPLEHSKHYILVEPSLNGTMNWDNMTWKYVTTFLRDPSPPLKGMAGERVTYAVPLNEINQVIYDPIENTYVPVKFIASGVRDPLGAGGFSNYRADTVRSDIVNNSFSTTINFYFARLSDLPRLNYKLKIQTPTELVDCNTRFGNKGPIVASTDPDSNELITIPYVNLNDPMATNIHVSTPDGIKALMKWQNEKEYNMRG